MPTMAGVDDSDDSDDSDEGAIPAVGGITNNMYAALTGPIGKILLLF
jgi:hypothetical protein